MSDEELRRRERESGRIDRVARWRLGEDVGFEEGDVVEVWVGRRWKGFATPVRGFVVGGPVPAGTGRPAGWKFYWDRVVNVQPAPPAAWGPQPVSTFRLRLVAPARDLS